MIWHIFRKELAENIISYRFVILTGLLLVLMVVSLLVSYGDYRIRMEDFTINRPQPNSSNVMIPPTPYSIFAKGVDAQLTRLHYLKFSGIEIQPVEQSVNRLFSLFIVPDMLFVVRVMLSLIALLFAFDAIVGEKEGGTLRLALASGGGRAALFFGKLLGRFALVFVPFAILFGTESAIVSLLPDVQVSAGYWPRVIFLLAASSLYVFVFSALGLFLSAVVHRSTSAMALGIAAWILLIFVVPQMGMTVASSAAAVPPSERVEMQNRLATIQAIFERIHQDRGNTMPGWKHLVEEIHASNSGMLEAYRPRLNEQIDLTRKLVRSSPAGLLTFLMTDASNTGVYEEMRYKDAITMFLARNSDIISSVSKGELENFTYERASLGEVLADPIPADFSLLGAFGAIFVSLAMVSIQRYDPR